MPAIPLSIVIPSHSRPDLLRLCLASVREHAPTSTQIIVVDDGSRDAVVSRSAEAIAGVRVIRHPRPLGFAVAANRGIAAAAGSIIELLNDDTQVTPGWAEVARSWFADPTVAAVAPLVVQGSPHAGVPVIDGVTAATKLVESLVALGLRTGKRGEYARPRPKRYSGLLRDFTS